MFTAADRDRVRAQVLALAAADARVVAGAVVGSLALDEGDRWSDLDLTFAVVDDALVLDVLEDWTPRLVAELDAVHLFDLPSGASLYRVFLLPGCLQFDLSFTPASQFGASGPKFRLLFGRSVDKPHTPPPSAEELFGHAVHHALRARFCIERGRCWQAEYWISGVRDNALALACRRRGLPARYGRGFDDLPAELRGVFRNALVGSLDRAELQRALASAVARLLDEAEEVKVFAAKVEPQLRRLADAGTGR
jgi:hypothetical protein